MKDDRKWRIIQQKHLNGTVYWEVGFGSNKRGGAQRLLGANGFASRFHSEDVAKYWADKKSAELAGDQS